MVSRRQPATTCPRQARSILGFLDALDVDRAVFATSGSAPRELTIVDLALDPDARTVHRNGQRLEVHGAAFDILYLLMERSPNVVGREELEASLWGDDPPQSDVLRSHIYALRRAIDKPFDRALLHTVRGYGYQLAAR